MADFTSVAMLTAGSDYGEIDFQMDTGFPQSENAFQLLMARDGSNDLFIIKKADTGTHSTEVHIYTSHPSPSTCLLQTGTALHETDISWTFALGVNRDVFAIRKSVNSSDHSQLHVLSHESGYQSFRHHSNILPEDHKLGHDYEFLLDSNDDLWVIKKQRTPSMTEIRVLSAASGYQTFVHQRPRVTGLPWTDLTWSFLSVDPNNKDVWVMNKKERHLYRLIATSLYQDREQVKLDFPKLEPRFDRRCSFALATNRTVVPATFDLYVFKTSRTSCPFVTFQVVPHPFHKHGPRLAKVRDAINIGFITTGDHKAFSWITRSTIAVNTNSGDSMENGDGVEESYLRIVNKIPTWTSTESYFTQVSFFRESSRFQGPGTTIVTPWPVTGDTCEFLFAKNMDMFVIKKSNYDSKNVEVRVLSWVSKYQSYTLDVSTVLDEVDHTWTFLLAENLDLTHGSHIRFPVLIPTESHISH